jgi:hypothetical protein
VRDIRGRLTVDMFGETKPESTDPWSAGDDSWEEVSVRESSAMLKTGDGLRHKELTGRGGDGRNGRDPEEERIGDEAFKVWLQRKKGPRGVRERAEVAVGIASRRG